MNILQRQETLELVSYIKLHLHHHFTKCIFVSHHAKEAEIFFLKTRMWSFYQNPLRATLIDP